MSLCICIWYQSCGIIAHHLPDRFSNNMIAYYNIFILMHLDANQNIWRSNVSHMNCHNVCLVPNVSSFIIWRKWHNWTNVIISYGVYYYPHKFPLHIWCTRDIDYDTNNNHFNHISCIFPPDFIIDNYKLNIEVSTSNDIIFLILFNNKSHLSINEFIHVVFK